MPAHQRLDYGSLGEAKRTPQGGMEIPADLTRAGVFTYHRDGAVVREWRPVAEVSRPATLDSLKNAPLTVGHPREGKVDPANYRKHAVGHVGTDVRMDGTKTAATLYIQSDDGLKAIDRGWRDVSCGYNCDTDETPGVVPAGEPDAGQSYDRVQRNIFYNHNAIVPRGRAGTARLHLDAADNIITEDTMKIEIIGGVEYEVGTAPHTDARTRQDAADKATKAQAAALAEANGKLAAQQARLDALDAAEKQRADAAALAALVAIAQPVLGKDWKADGLSTEQITAAVIAKQFPGVRLDAVAEAERPAFVKGLMAGIVAPKSKETRNDAKPAPRQVPFPGASRAPRQGTAAYRQDALDEMESTCRAPLSLSKRKPREDVPMATQIENRS